LQGKKEWVSFMVTVLRGFNEDGGVSKDSIMSTFLRALLYHITEKSLPITSSEY
jgi:hypothetical protein